MVARAAVGLETLVEDGTDGAERVLQVGVAPAADEGGSRGRLGQTQQDTHAGGLARAVGPEERRDAPWRYLGREVVERRDGPVAFGHVVNAMPGASLGGGVVVVSREWNVVRFASRSGSGQPTSLLVRDMVDLILSGHACGARLRRNAAT